MDYTFIFKISKDSITISEDKRTIDKKGLNNTNVIDTKELKFSPEYILTNSELVASFLNVVIIKYNISKCIINTTNNLDLLVGLVNYWEKINELVIKPDVQIDHTVFMKLLDNNFLISFECYKMAPYLIDRLDKNKSFRITTREKKNFTSNFMNDNQLSSYTDIYYKKHILIYSEFDENELIDVQNFMGINNNLKSIRLVKFSNEMITTIIDELQKNQFKNVLVMVDEKNNDLDAIYKTIPFLRKTYKKYLTENNISFRINYSFEYKRKNFFKEFNLKVLSTIILFLVLIVGGIFGVNYYKEYRDKNKIEDQMTEINKIIEEFTIDTGEQPIDDPTGTVETPDNPSEPQTQVTYVPGTYYTNYSRVFEELDKINSDTVAWIKINNTRMDYPVVQSNDNNYYLGRDYKKKKNSMGWIFMDYRNNPKDLDKNTIVYGHNIKGGIMFGGIASMFSNSYLSKPINNEITFNTKYANMKWKIFSMYRIDPTTDYLQNEFLSDEDFMEFITTIRSRSQFQFDVEVNANSKILTLSTCYNNKSRNVVHAVLIEETKTQ